MNEELQKGGEYLDLIIGGGGASVLTALYLFHQFVFKPKVTELEEKIKDDSNIFIELNQDFADFKNLINGKLVTLELAQREQERELRTMTGDMKLLDQKLAFIEQTNKDLKEDVKELKDSFNSFALEIKTILLEKR